MAKNELHCIDLSLILLALCSSLRNFTVQSVPTWTGSFYGLQVFPCSAMDTDGKFAIVLFLTAYVYKISFSKYPGNPKRFSMT